MNKGWKYRIYPTPDQAKLITLNIDGAKAVYNTALYIKITQYKNALCDIAKSLNIVLQYTDDACTQIDMSDDAISQYRDAIISATCAKYNVTPVYKTSSKNGTQYLDVTKTKQAIYTAIFANNNWPIITKSNNTPDYNAMKQQCKNAGYSFDFDVPLSDNVPLTYFTRGEHAEYYKQLDSNAINGALRNLQTAYKNFYTNLSKGNAKGFPQYKRRGLRDAITGLPNPLNITGSYTTKTTNAAQGFTFIPYTTEDGQISQKYEMIRIAKLGWVKIRKHRPIPDNAKLSAYATVSRNTAGMFFISLHIETPDTDVTKTLSPNSVIGYELSIGQSYIIDNNNRRYAPLDTVEKLQNKLQYKQQQLSFMKTGSNNWHKKQFEIQRLHNRITRIKDAQITQLAEQIVKRSDYICFRDTDVAELKKKPIEIDDIELKKNNQPIPKITDTDRKYLRKYYRSDRENHATGINDMLTFLAQARRAFQDQCWAKLIEEVEKKAQRDGKVVLKTADYALTTQLCSNCGAVNEDMAGIANVDKTTFICPECGHTINRDLNSAINIKNMCLSQIS